MSDGLAYCEVCDNALHACTCEATPTYAQEVEEQDSFIGKLYTEAQVAKLSKKDAETIARLTAERDRLAAIVKEAGEQKEIVKKMMYRLAKLLDEDQFNEMDNIVNHAGIHPPIREGWVMADALLKRCYDYITVTNSDTDFDMDHFLSELHADVHIYLYDKGLLSAIKKD